MILLSIILFVAAVALNVWLDYRIWKRQYNSSSNKRNHVTGAIIKSASCTPSLLIMASESNLRWVFALIVTGLGMYFWFSLLFSGFYNIARREPFFWDGTEDGHNDSALDNFWQSLPEWFSITIKLVLPAVFIYLYYLGLLK